MHYISIPDVDVLVMESALNVLYTGRLVRPATNRKADKDRFDKVVDLLVKLKVDPELIRALTADTMDVRYDILLWFGLCAVSGF